MIKIGSETSCFGFGQEYAPVAHVKSGDEVLFECVKRQSKEGSNKDLVNKINRTGTNPVYGPLFVEGAQPGDVLKVVIHELQIDDFGTYGVAPGHGILGDMVQDSAKKTVHIREGMAIFSEELRIPLSPNIGTLGVAPSGRTIPSSYPGDHGGNLDTKEIRKNATVYLPVFVPGALFALGDLHICIADGEICGSGGGTNGHVRVNLSLLKNKSIKRPLLNADERWFTIASGNTLDEAVRKATEDMVTLLETSLKIPFNEAYILASAVCDVKISQAVNPLKTARVAVPQYVFQKKTPI